MHSRLQNIAGLALAVGVAAVAVGCGGGEDAEGPAGAPAGPATTIAQGAPPAAAPGSSTTITSAPAAAQSPGPPIQVTAVSASAPSHAGSCPVNLSLSGTIVASGPGSATYSFVRSDGFSTPPQTVSVQAGSTPVSGTWEVGSPGASTSAWAALQVVSPTLIRSERVDYTVACDHTPPRKPTSGGGY